MTLVKCPDCGKEISDQAPACPNCGRPAVPRPVVAAPPPATETTGKAGRTLAAILILSVVVGGAFLMVIIKTAGKGGSSTGASSSSSYHRSPRIGEERTLRTGASSPSVPVFETKDALNEVAAAGTDQSLAAVIMGGGAFVVDQGTRVLIVETGGDTTKVRVLEGLMVGRAGFVPSKWCRE